MVGARIIHKNMIGDLILISKHGQMIRLPLNQLPTTGRATQGVYVMRLKSKDKVASLSLIIEEENIEEKPARAEAHSGGKDEVKQELPLDKSKEQPKVQRTPDSSGDKPKKPTKPADKETKK